MVNVQATGPANIQLRSPGTVAVIVVRNWNPDLTPNLISTAVQTDYSIEQLRSLGQASPTAIPGPLSLGPFNVVAPEAALVPARAVSAVIGGGV